MKAYERERLVRLQDKINDALRAAQYIAGTYPNERRGKVAYLIRQAGEMNMREMSDAAEPE